MTTIHAPFDEPGAALPWLQNVNSFYDSPLDIQEFHGPGTAHCFGHSYETLTTHGVKKECEVAQGPLVWNVCEAWHAYKLTLLAYMGDNALQIAWRALPEAQQTCRGDWEIYSRLYVWRGQ